MGFNDISLYNGGAADGSLQTPNIDAIAQDGVTFTNGYAANAICAPSRASILTGRYSTRFGFEFTPVYSLAATITQWSQDIDPSPLPPEIDHAAAEAMRPMDELKLPDSEITIAEVLKKAGYYTAHIGKWHLGDSSDPQKQGFDDSLYMKGIAYLPPDHPDVVNSKREEDTIEKMVWAVATYENQFNNSESFQPDGYLTDYYTNEAVKVIENNQNRPFFLYLAHWGIHNPLQATRADYDKFSHIKNHSLRVYAGMIQALDRSVGTITAKLDELGLSENTKEVSTHISSTKNNYFNHSINVKQYFLNLEPLNRINHVFILQITRNFLIIPPTRYCSFNYYSVWCWISQHHVYQYGR